MIHSEMALRQGARGFLVRDLQEALGCVADGVFGDRTARAVEDARARAGMGVGGGACARLHTFLGIRWPSEYLRCLNLTSVLEGTSFGDVNATDIDGAGLTFGCVGFTTAHGEVQEVLRRFLASAPEAGNGTRIGDDVRSHVSGAPSDAAWKAFAFDCRGVVRRELAGLLAEWGRHPQMRAVQVDYVHELFWQPASATCARLGLKTLAAQAMLFDVQVQNGGWGARHEQALEAPLASLADESRRLAAMARAVARCANPRWRGDVLRRKMLFALDSGVVHGIRIDLRSFALA